MKYVLRIVGSILAGAIGSPLGLAQSTLVVPNDYANKAGFGAGGAAEPFDQANPVRVQFLYDASQFSSGLAGGAYLSAVSFRSGLGQGQDRSVQVNGFEIHLSTTTQTADSLSKRFSENIGVGETVVLAAGTPVTLRTGNVGNPRSFTARLPFSTPFFYNPAAGNLLVDFFVTSTVFLGEMDLPLTEGISGVTGSPQFPEGVLAVTPLITQFQFQPVPEPSLGLAVLFAGGFVRVVLLRRRRDYV